MILARHPERSAKRDDGLDVAPDLDAAKRLADREQPDRDDHHVDAVEQLRDPETHSRVAGQRVDADEAEHEPEEELARPFNVDSPSTDDTATNASMVRAKYSAGPNRSAALAISGAENVSAAVASAGDERPDGGRRQRRAAAGTRHQVPSTAVITDALSPGIQQRWRSSNRRTCRRSRCRQT